MQPFNLVLNIVQEEEVVIDYFPETYRYTVGVINKVYF